MYGFFVWFVFMARQPTHVIGRLVDMSEWNTTYYKYWKQ
jgi:hypothetical protein